jgi:hypothetical protein
MELILQEPRELALGEQERLIECETIIRVGLDTFVKVGRALAEIRDSRLYRGSFATFEEYCEITWNMAARTAHQTIASANVVHDLGDCIVLPERESVARQLVGLPADEAKRVWLEAIANNSKVTAALLRRLVQRANHVHQPLPKVTQTTCPECRHQFVPYKPETASRGTRVASPGLAWACSVIPDDVRSAVDYGCGRFRNAGPLQQRFDRVLYADTKQQCARLGDIAAEKNLIPVDELQPRCADAVFIIAVLHVLRNAKERQQLARFVMSLRPRYIVVETPRNQCYYKDKLKRGCYRSREGTFYWELRNEQIDRLFVGHYTLKAKRTVKHNACRVLLLN